MGFQARVPGWNSFNIPNISVWNSRLEFQGGILGIFQLFQSGIPGWNSWNIPTIPGWISRLEFSEYSSGTFRNSYELFQNSKKFQNSNIPNTYFRKKTKICTETPKNQKSQDAGR